MCSPQHGKELRGRALTAALQKVVPGKGWRNNSFSNSIMALHIVDGFQPLEFFIA
jgi:hypothetical protein